MQAHGAEFEEAAGLVRCADGALFFVPHMRRSDGKVGRFVRKRWGFFLINLAGWGWMGEGGYTR